MTPDELLTTTRSVRKRLDLDRPVPRHLLEECIDIATQAPTGSNRQGWHFVFVTDPAKKKAIADWYGQSFDRYINLAGPEYEEGDVRGERREHVRSSSMYLRDNFHRVPVMLIPCHEGRLKDGAGNTMQAGFWGSILPAAWSFMLAARARGLGSAWTTLHLPFEREVADLLGIPYETVTQAGLFPVAYYNGESFKPASRIPPEKIVHWEAW